MKTQRGFTLIELIICIVLLGILSAVAVTKFLNFRVEARNSTLLSVSGRIESQISMVYSKLTLAGLEKRNPNRNDPVVGGGYYGDEPESNPFKNICGHQCYFIYGTPSTSATTLSSIMDGIGQDDDIVFAGYHSNDWKSEGVTGTNIVGTFSLRNNVNIGSIPALNSLKTDNCFIWYSGARKDRSYKIGIVPCK